jgi:HEAT repeat protein
VEPLGQLLRDDSIEVRGRAIYGLGKTGLAGAGSLLVEELTDENRLIRKRVVVSLVSWITKMVLTSTGEDEELMEVRRALKKLATEGDEELRYHATFGLAILREPLSLEGVEEALQSQDVTVRRRAIEVLGHSGQWDHLKFILERLMDTDPSVRKAAATALGTFGLEFPSDLRQELIVEDALSKALGDEVARVCEAACESWYCRKERWENMKP